MVTTKNKFNFSEVSLNEVEDEIKKLNIKKGSTFKNITPKILKDNSDICCPVLMELINDAFNKIVFPDELKVADVTPVFKKDDATNVKNYRQLAYYQLIRKYSNELCTLKFPVL